MLHFPNQCILGKFLVNNLVCRWAVKKGQKYVMWFVNYQKIAVYRGNSDMGRSVGQKCILKDDSLELVYF